MNANGWYKSILGSNQQGVCGGTIHQGFYGGILQIPAQWYAPEEEESPQVSNKKEYAFLAEYIGYNFNPVETLSGIGLVHGARLRKFGFHLAYQVFLQFLAFNPYCREQMFKQWLHEKTNANTLNQSRCYHCLQAKLLQVMPRYDGVPMMAG